MAQRVVHYISHGKLKTGGHRHEVTLVNALVDLLHAKEHQFRYPKHTNGLIGALKLWWFAFKNSGSFVNVTVQRLVFPVWLKSVFTGANVLVVVHHFDKRETRSWLHNIQFWLLVTLVKLNLRNLKLVVVSPYWVNFFSLLGVEKENILLFPNLFSVNEYAAHQPKIKNNKQVYLGQFGEKQHDEIYTLASLLTDKGYQPFFTTLDAANVLKTETYEVVHLSDSEYKNKIACSLATVCFSKFNEGWNRVAHESLLLGVPVIGNDAGGLTDLLTQAEQYVVSNANEALSLLEAKLFKPTPSAFISAYDVRQIPYYAKPIVDFCNKNGIG